MNPPGVPIGHGDRPAGPTDTDELRRRTSGSRREHRAEHAGDHVEGRVVIGQILGIALVEADGQAVAPGIRAGLVEQVRGDVDAGDVGAGPCRGKREIAGAAGNVEEPRIPAVMPRRAAKAAAVGSLNFAMRPKSPAIHTAFIPALIAFISKAFIGLSWSSERRLPQAG